MELKEVIKKRRTKRLFNDKKVDRALLETLIEYARYAPFGANLQALKYIIIEEKNLVKDIFPFTKWSGYHPENAPGNKEKPTSYIAILGDTKIKEGNFETDAGSAGTIISLVAEDVGLSSCWLGSIDRKEISKLLNLEERYKLLYLIALGYSDQKAKAIDSTGDIKYFTDEDGVLTVPKRTTDEIVLLTNTEKCV